MHFSFTVFPLQTNENRAHSLNSFLLPKLVRGNCKFRITAVPFFFVLLQFPAWSLNETCWQVPSMRNCYGFDGPQPVPAGLPAFPGRDCSWAQLEFVLVHTFIFSTCSRAERGSPTFHESFESVAAPKVHIFHSCPVRVGFRDKLSAARQELIRRNCFHSGGTEREREGFCFCTERNHRGFSWREEPGRFPGSPRASPDTRENCQTNKLIFICSKCPR